MPCLTQHYLSYRSLVDLYTELDNEVSWLHAKYAIFHQLYATSEERIALLSDTAPSFFRIIHNVLIDDIVLTLGRLTDPPESRAQRNLCVRQLLVAAQGLSDNSLLQALTTGIDKLDEACAPFRVARNKRIAHADLETTLARASRPLPPVTLEGIEKSLALLRSLLNQVIGHFESAETAYEHVILRGDGDTVAFYLQAARDHEKAKREAALAALKSRKAGA